MKALVNRFKRYWGALAQIVAEHADYRVQIVQLARADIIKTYRGSALGWLWAGIKPTVTIFVFWFAFTVGLRAGGGVEGANAAGEPTTYPFFLWLVAGIVPWFYISEMLTQGTKALKRYSYLVTKIKFPVSTIPTFVSLSKLYVHLALLGVATALFLTFGYPFDIYFLQLPLYVFLLFFFFTVWTLLAAPLSAVSKDFLNVINSFVTAIFWMSGIMWDVNKIHIPWIKNVLLFNPVTFIATGYRNVFVYKRWIWEDTFALTAFSVVLVATCLIALFTYQKLRRDIADVL